MLSAVAPLEAAKLAPSLKEAALRVLLHLALEAQRTGRTSIAASSRDLELGIRIARSAIVRALDELAQRGIIATRAGTPTKPAVHSLQFLEVLELPLGGGPLRGPLTTEKGVDGTAQVVLFEDQGGPFRGPPPHGKPTTYAESVENSPSVDPEGVLLLEGILDRLSKAKAKSFDPKTLAAARGFLHSYRAKFPPPDERDTPHAPDDGIVAQFLALGEGAGGWPRLQAMLYDLMGERHTAGHSYAWFVSIAAQRLHGIDPRKLSHARKQLRIVRETARESKRAEEPPTTQQLGLAIAAAAAGKRMR